jgi:two-component system response regulator CpxR
MRRILLADDDQAFCDLLKQYLAREGYAVDAVHDGLAAIKSASDGAYDVMILDVMMPRADGFRVLKELRSPGRMPILMLTARGEDVDKIVGLEMGADDYLAKPCNPRELAARLKAILRRTQAHAGGGEAISCGDLELAPAARAVTLAGQPIDLTGAEFDVLRVLVEDAGRVVSKEDLARRALRRPLGLFDRSIDMHVSRLRNKLGDASVGGPRIKTVRNRGYVYAAAP